MDLAPKPQFALGTPLDQLPKEIERKCCLQKGCGNTHLILEVTAALDSTSPTGASVHYAYNRESNGDQYFCAATVDGLIEQLNDPEYWPVDVE